MHQTRLESDLEFTTDGDQNSNEKQRDSEVCQCQSANS
jgi:hypothetical protein